MGRPRLRVYTGPDSENAWPKDRSCHPNQGEVNVQLSEIFPVLADAMIHDRSWLHDFQDEVIKISSDLYDILQAYAHLHRHSVG